mmetsp:Transcript_66255/g.205146  ORF Transcript_66255/g.205146 Transcript_66255/m.205146 type:complete len:227 (+) Transcript_66255:1-681(+)
MLAPPSMACEGMADAGGGNSPHAVSSPAKPGTQGMPKLAGCPSATPSESSEPFGGPRPLPRSPRSTSEPAGSSSTSFLTPGVTGSTWLKRSPSFGSSSQARGTSGTSKRRPLRCRLSSSLSRDSALFMMPISDSRSCECQAWERSRTGFRRESASCALTTPNSWASWTYLDRCWATALLSRSTISLSRVDLGTLWASRAAMTTALSTMVWDSMMQRACSHAWTPPK